jgi:hypothetical protein
MTVTPYKLPRWPGSNAKPPIPPANLEAEDDPLRVAFAAATVLIDELTAYNASYAELLVEATEQRDQAKDRLARAEVMNNLLLKWLHGDLSTSALREMVGNLIKATGIKNDDE